MRLLTRTSSISHFVTTTRARLARPVDIAPLVYFRIVFGAIMLWEVCRYFSHDWIYKYFIEPPYLAKYYLFEWVQPLPGDGMYALFLLLGLAALCITLGLWYRPATIIFFIGFSYVFLLDASRYLNHFYLVCIISFLLIFIPSHRAGSLDAKFYPAIRSNTLPAWCLYLILFQISVAYFFAGVAKITPDWLHGEPIGQWLRDRADLPVIGGLFEYSWAGYLFAYGGMLLDLAIVPLLLIRRSRPFIFAIAIAFHGTNALLFSIGIFPWFMLASTLMFFPAEHFRTVLTRLKILPQVNTGTKAVSGDALSKLAFGGIALFAAWQVLMPLRHFLYSSNPSWSDEGHRFAWHMKLRDKEAKLQLTVRSRDSVWYINPRKILREHQFDQVASTPDLLVEFARSIGDQFVRSGHSQVTVKANALAALNGRPAQYLVDPNRDLMTIDRSIMAADWILPLRGSLPPATSSHPEREHDLSTP